MPLSRAEKTYLLHLQTHVSEDTPTQQRNRLKLQLIYYRELAEISPIPETRERCQKRYEEVLCSQFFLDGCNNCGEIFANHVGLWTLNADAQVGDKEKVNTGIFEVCYILKRLSDRTNYMGHRVEAVNPCDDEFMEEIST